MNFQVLNQPAPEVDLPTLDGGRVRLNQFRGKVVLVNFWASWCVPCRKAIPHWKEVYKQYGGKGLEIVGW